MLIKTPVLKTVPSFWADRDTVDSLHWPPCRCSTGGGSPLEDTSRLLMLGREVIVCFCPTVPVPPPPLHSQAPPMLQPS